LTFLKILMNRFFESDLILAANFDKFSKNCLTNIEKS
jgi:hypothetical protein